MNWLINWLKSRNAPKVESTASLKPINAAEARKAVQSAFDAAYSHRDDDALRAMIAYLDAKLAYCQATVLHASGDEMTAIQLEGRWLTNMKHSFTADPGKPRSI